MKFPELPIVVMVKAIGNMNVLLYKWELGNGNKVNAVMERMLPSQYSL